jgi:8-oxo-dGTP pyrophosphatase MutT (NUDIX family)
VIDIDLINLIEERLKLPLPGEKAQLRMGSDIRMKELKWIPENKTTRHSGVMILLYPQHDSIYSVLIQRPHYKGTHGGQVSLPGGKKETCDADIIQTALRETQEEIGVGMNSIRILGSLTRLYIPPSNFVIFPVVGFTKKKPVFKLEASEVEDIIEYDISSLLHPDIRKTTQIKVEEVATFNAPYFDILGKIVWGATGMVLSEFRALLAEVVKK